MKRLNPLKLHVTYLTGTTPEDLVVPRLYTLTHSDITGELFLSIGNQYDKKQISGLYTRLMRDEVLAELCDDENQLILKVYCHVSGGLVIGTARWRYNIFQHELPLVLEALRYGDRILFKRHPELDQTPVHIFFKSNNKRFNKIEHWGTIADYGPQ
ncbi:MAG TPA: hypothetical protein G4O10_05010 [Dehalococcoidia bacterium]|nr:hypothetical protein [Dehalococcoidia bacterium]